MVNDNLRPGERVIDHRFSYGPGTIVKREMYKDKLSRYAIKFDKPVPWKDNIGYFMARELQLLTPEREQEFNSIQEIL